MTKTVMKPSLISSRLDRPSFLMAVVFFIGLLYHWWPDMPTKHVLIVFVVPKAWLDLSFGVSQSINNQCIGGFGRAALKFPATKESVTCVGGCLNLHRSPSWKSKTFSRSLYHHPAGRRQFFKPWVIFKMNLLPWQKPPGRFKISWEETVLMGRHVVTLSPCWLLTWNLQADAILR